MKNAKWTLGLVIALLFLASCEQGPTQIRLTSSERIRIDTLTKQRVDTLIPVLDSLCEAQYDSLVQEALDSIINLRRSEERKIRERLKQQQQQ
ncbi:MAG: hypothetical protein GVY26_06925 [Bacteroidetes bacterium]|jgi:uncharacterized lipoprotein YajG|nr:hypothetical protein [Bacteroidota bacterium]HKK79572.1 hypothetical protein [Phaeodactylibacter sp.]